MREHLDPDVLLAHALGELDAARAEEVQAHAARCTRCAGEVAWAERDVGALASLNGEDDLGPLPSFEAIAPRRRHESARSRLAAWTAAVAAAAIVAGLVVRSTGIGKEGRSDYPVVAVTTAPAAIAPVMRPQADPLEGDEPVCAPVRVCSPVLNASLCSVTSE
jgi:anti-sigma factor RsiW